MRDSRWFNDGENELLAAFNEFDSMEEARGEADDEFDPMDVFLNDDFDINSLTSEEYEKRMPAIIDNFNKCLEKSNYDFINTD